MRKNKLFLSKPRAGITLVELIIVVAISSFILIIAISTNLNRGRREFDNGMKQLVAELRNIQNETQAGVGPDPALKCSTIPILDLVNPYVATNQRIRGVDSGTGTDLAECPVGELFGDGVVFGNNEVDDVNIDEFSTPIPVTMSFKENNVEIPGSDPTGRNYYQQRLSELNTLTINQITKGLGIIYAVFPYGKPIARALPSNVVFRNSCAPDGTNLCDDLANFNENKAAIVFAKYAQKLASDAEDNAPGIPLTTYATTDSVDFYSPELTDFNNLYSKYKIPIRLWFSDYSNQYNGIITIKPADNSISLELR